ncbi:MAG: hypothetical protein WCO22_06675 [Betaproteobacteria bacterium]
MSLDLSSLKSELQENYLRTEEVLTGMDAYIAAMGKRFTGMEAHVAALEKRVTSLESQIVAVLASIYDDGDTLDPQSPRIYLGPGP